MMHEIMMFITDEQRKQLVKTIFDILHQEEDQELSSHIRVHVKIEDLEE